MAPRILVVTSMVALLGCGRSERPTGPAAAPASPVMAPPATPPSADPALDELAEPPAADEVAAAPSPLAPRAPAPLGCALQSAPIRVLADGGPPVVLAQGEGFLVAAYTQSGATIVRIVPGALPRPFASIALESPPRRAAPGLAGTGPHEATIALLDGHGRVHAASFDPTLPVASPRATPVADGGADARFSPAVRGVGTRRIVAWTDASATPMRVRVAVLGRDGSIARHDVTPIAGGGAAPTFLEGSDEPLLFFVDPRVGISVVHRVSFAADATPGPTEVSRPLNLAAEPPHIAVVRGAAGPTWLAYTAVGNLATRAVGLVRAVGDERPMPLVPGLGYGEPLTVDGVAEGPGAVFAAQAPSAADPRAPHEVRLRVVDERGIGEPLRVGPPAREPSLARRQDGLIALAYRAGEAVMLHFVRCAGRSLR